LVSIAAFASSVRLVSVGCSTVLIHRPPQAVEPRSGPNHRVQGPTHAEYQPQLTLFRLSAFSPVVNAYGKHGNVTFNSERRVQIMYMATNSLLTKKYRELIERDAKEPVTGQKARKYRNRMRKRVTQGLGDCAKLNQYARSSDIEKIFHRDDTDRRQYDNPKLPDEREDLLQCHWVSAMHMVSLLWRGLRLNGMDKQEIFKRAISDGIVWGEAEYKGVDMGVVEQDISLNKLEAHTDTDELEPLEKWKRGLALTGDDYQEITDRLHEHPDVDTVLGKDIHTLVEKHLIEDSESDD